MSRLAEPLKEVHVVCGHIEKALIKLIRHGVVWRQFGRRERGFEACVGVFERRLDTSVKLSMDS